MSLRDFIKRHRKELDSYISKALGGTENHRYANDDERRVWVLNDEYLYNWARSEGVKI
jgi:hypothetical protein